MGSSGGGGVYGGSGPRIPMEELREIVRGEQDDVGHKAEVNEILAEALQSANTRDSELAGQRLEDVQEAIEDLLEESVNLRFGGSVSKHTYVDGLSDVDALLILNRASAEGKSPKELLAELAGAIADRVHAEVAAGDLAITVRFSDGMELQLLPAFQAGDGYRIARPRGETWSDVIRPKRFAEALTEVNQANGGNVVPAIKLFKIAQENLPRNARLSGYHIEALATAAFDGYQGQVDRKSVFLHLLRSAADKVAMPIAETTGQSTYVDRYLGGPDSPERERVAGHIRRLARRLDSADEKLSTAAWEEAFDTS